MRETYEGKVAVVTGAADGMGLGLCRRLAELGAYVVLGDINGEKLAAEAARICQEHPGHALARVADVTKKDQIRGLIRKAVEWKGFVHFLFNNAGMGGTLPVDQLDLEDWRSLFELNFWSVLQGIYSVLPLMRMQGGGHIVNTSSIAGIVPLPYQEAYCATKYAVSALGQCLRYELWDENIRFSTVCPGNVATSIFGDGASIPEDAVSVEEAVETILEGVGRNENLIVFPQSARDLWEELSRRPQEQERILLDLARTRKENYHTKGRYY